MTRTDAPLRRNPGFRRLVATTVSNEFSSAIGAIVLPLLVLGSTGSATLAGAVLFVTQAVLIASQVFGGALVDRYSASRTLRASSALQALGWAAVLAGTLLGGGWLILLGAALAAAASGVDGPSEHTLIKHVVPQAALGRATAVSQGREAAAGLAGKPVGGLLFGISAQLALGVQVVLHVVAAVCTPRVSVNRERTAPEPFLASLRAGFGMVIRHPGLRGLALVAGVANLPVIMMPLTLLADYQANGVPAGMIGILSSAFVLGMLVGAFLAGPLASRMPLGILGIIGIGAFAIGQVVVVFTHANFWVTVVVLAVSALPLPAFNSAIGAYTAAVTPAAAMGRVVAASGVPGMILMPIGSLLAGVLFDAQGVLVPLIVSASAAVASAVLMLASRSIRRIPKVSELREEVPAGA
ncbi:MFS transporter [Agromyces archimandritae]|uniref:MFS transporter n=1 Tax=Agromyces archimandritae TaxID=2781962 RepID=A0A975IML1_9MICO|nr:MFS transporter [Agromyces archimandritae]QTX03622.1 MFS transporter [Agromyces archimandritae]